MSCSMIDRLCEELLPPVCRDGEGGHYRLVELEGGVRDTRPPADRALLMSFLQMSAHGALPKLARLLGLHVGVCLAGPHLGALRAVEIGVFVPYAGEVFRCGSICTWDGRRWVVTFPGFEEHAPEVFDTFQKALGRAYEPLVLLLETFRRREELLAGGTVPGLAPMQPVAEMAATVAGVAVLPDVQKRLAGLRSRVCARGAGEEACSTLGAVCA